MSLKPTIEELLALRDGEAIDPQRARALEADDDARDSLHALREIRQSLADLPELEPRPEVWAEVQARAAQARAVSGGVPAEGGWRTHMPLAAAASIFMAAVIGMLVWQPFEQTRGPQAVPLNISDLVVRSQELESQVGLPVTNAPTASETALFYRLADIDIELNALDAQRATQGLTPDEEAWRKALWQRRIALLESLRTVQQAEQPEFTHAIY